MPAADVTDGVHEPAYHDTGLTAEAGSRLPALTKTEWPLRRLGFYSLVSLIAVRGGEGVLN